LGLTLVDLLDEVRDEAVVVDLTARRVGAAGSVVAAGVADGAREVAPARGGIRLAA
jgi:hypothetical protein